MDWESRKDEGLQEVVYNTVLYLPLEKLYKIYRQKNLNCEGVPSDLTINDIVKLAKDNEDQLKPDEKKYLATLEHCLDESEGYPELGNTVVRHLSFELSASELQDIGMKAEVARDIGNSQRFVGATFEYPGDDGTKEAEFHKGYSVVFRGTPASMWMDNSDTMVKFPGRFWNDGKKIENISKGDELPLNYVRFLQKGRHGDLKLLTGFWRQSVLLSGHSKGGRQAALVMLLMPQHFLRCYSLDGPEIAAATKEEVKELYGESYYQNVRGHIITINEENDLVHVLGAEPGVELLAGESYSLQSENPITFEKIYRDLGNAEGSVLRDKLSALNLMQYHYITALYDQKTGKRISLREVVEKDGDLAMWVRLMSGKLMQLPEDKQKSACQLLMLCAQLQISKSKKGGTDIAYYDIDAVTQISLFLSGAPVFGRIAGDAWREMYGKYLKDKENRGEQIAVPICSGFHQYFLKGSLTVQTISEGFQLLQAAVMMGESLVQAFPDHRGKVQAVLSQYQDMIQALAARELQLVVSGYRVLRDACGKLVEEEKPFTNNLFSFLSVWEKSNDMIQKFFRNPIIEKCEEMGISRKGDFLSNIDRQTRDELTGLYREIGQSLCSLRRSNVPKAMRGQLTAEEEAELKAKILDLEHSNDAMYRSLNEISDMTMEEALRLGISVNTPETAEELKTVLKEFSDGAVLQDATELRNLVAADYAALEQIKQSIDNYLFDIDLAKNRIQGIYLDLDDLRYAHVDRRGLHCLSTALEKRKEQFSTHQEALCHYQESCLSLEESFRYRLQESSQRKLGGEKDVLSL